MVIGATPQCLECKHYQRDRKRAGFGCAAFPDAIPEAIFWGDHDHTEPYPGDNGILFEPIAKQGPKQETR